MKSITQSSISAKAKNLFLGLALISLPAISHAGIGGGSMTFGKPQGPTHAACAGVGVCDQVADPGGPNTGYTNVSMYVLESNPAMLVINFSLSELKTNQPDQVQNFFNGSGTYNFDADYPLTDPIYSNLGLLPNPVVTTTSPTAVVINGDIVSLYINYSYTQQ